jgi:hypothetical protein
MPKLFAETAHEAGRQGSLRAKHLLSQVLGKAIDLPFNAYDHGPKLTFTENDPQATQFSFDLGGIVRRPDGHSFAGELTTDVFVEVKNHSTGDALLAEFKAFLRRAAIVASQPKHADTWFIFLASVPFGTTQGLALCDGSLIAQCRKEWPSSIQEASESLHERVALFVATRSFERLLTKWGRND